MPFRRSSAPAGALCALAAFAAILLLNLVSLPAARAAGAEPALQPAQRAAARVHAQDVADLFRDACVATRSDPEAVADWALVNGLVTDSPQGKEVAAAMRERGETGNVFTRTRNSAKMLLISSGSPSNCLVMGLDVVDGPRLRSRMEGIAGEWAGGKAQPEPDRSMDYDEDGAAHRRVSYLGAVGAELGRLTVVSPVGTARGVVILGLSVEPRVQPNVQPHVQPNGQPASAPRAAPAKPR